MTGTFNLSMGGMSLAKYLKNHQVTVLGTEQVGEKQCNVLQCSRSDGSNIKVWTDPKAGFRIGKREVYDGGGELVSRCETEFTEWSEGVWFPSSGTTLIYGNGESGERVLYEKRMVKVKKVISGISISPSAFSVDFPPGTHVTDLTNYEFPVEYTE